MAIKFSGDDGIILPDSSLPINDSSGGGFKSAIARFGATMNDTSNAAIQRDGNGQHVAIYRTFFTPKNITVNTSTNRWTHTYTGVYRCYVQFRQASGADVWNFMSVTKLGSFNVVGSSARMGSENSHRELFTFMYAVDSTTATYQLQGWSAGDVNYSGGGSSSPGWSTTYETWQTGSLAGKSLDVSIYRVGDL